ncbi:MAG: DUF1972 domain-containing protein [Muribaculum sp.]|nr:DUF1972 domain-containing protein [Muribaculum sp.]
MIKVAIVGTQGVPAKYGGFESLAENLLGNNCPDDVQYTVFCSSIDMPERLKEYKGALLRYVPFKANGIQSVPYDIVSMWKCLRGYDVILVLGISGGLFLPIFHMFNKRKLIINIDGQEYKREKWGRFAKFVLRVSEALAVKYADVVIADNKGIQDYVSEVYHRPSTLISYGGDHAKREITEEFAQTVLEKYGVKENDYAITVCRIEPENNSEIVLDAFSRTDKTLVYIGNWDHSDFSRTLREKFSKYGNIKMLDAIYDLDVLYALRSKARIYVHGHSAGGTNPSLVEAMFFGIPIASYDVVYNRETTERKAYYFKDADELLDIVNAEHLSGSQMKKIAERRYKWRIISRQYSELYQK